jgi:hypothetical protein
MPGPKQVVCWVGDQKIGTGHFSDFAGFTGEKSKRGRNGPFRMKYFALILLGQLFDHLQKVIFGTINFQVVKSDKFGLLRSKNGHFA